MPPRWIVAGVNLPLTRQPASNPDPRTQHRVTLARRVLSDSSR
jgi:hypothetical protein